MEGGEFLVQGDGNSVAVIEVQGLFSRVTRL